MAVTATMPIADLRARLAAMQPQPWPSDRAAAAGAMREWHDNSGASVVTQKRQPPRAPAVSAPPPQPPPPPLQQNGAPRTAAVEVLRGVEETQRRSVAALKAMVELLIEKGVFSREEYLGRVKR